MKIAGNAIRPGNVIEHQGKLWRAVNVQHTQPGKGGAYMQVELKELMQGTKLNERFRSSETVERVRLDQKEYQYLYNDGDDYTFMDQETYDQITLSADLFIENQISFLQEEMIVSIESYEGKPISVILPESVTMEIVESEPVIKGQTATGSYKPAILENGARVMVPPHIEMGSKVVVSTVDGKYLEKAKN